MTTKRMSPIKRRVWDATVAITANPNGGSGQGVLVAGGYVLTAAHCLEWTAEGYMALEEHHVERVKPRTGAAFRMAVLAVEPVADIAVLGAADGQAFYSDADAFEEFSEGTAPVPICLDKIEIDRPVSLEVLTHHNTWIAAEGKRYGLPGAREGATMCIVAKRAIEGGTSGGPVVDIQGRLVGLVSSGSGIGEEDTREGRIARPHLALPRWIAERIEAAQRKLAATKRKAK